MRYASCALCVAFGAGAAASLLLDVCAPIESLASAGVLLAVGALLRRRARWMLWILCVCALGVWRASVESQPPTWLAMRTAGLREVVGTVVSYPSLGPRGIRFVLQPQSLPGALLVTWYRAPPQAGRVRFGDVLRLTGRAQDPGVFDGFDYGAYLARQGVFATFAADEARLETREARPGIRRTGDAIRQACLATLEERLSPDEFAMAQSLVFGDRFALPRDVEDAFAESGLTHVLAVSGMHLTILLAGVWAILRRVGARATTSTLVLALFVLGSVWIIGPWVSLSRAALLFLAVALGRLLADRGLILRRSVRPLNALAVAASVLLAIQPSDVLDLGFGLSVCATAGLVVFGSSARRGRRSSTRLGAVSAVVRGLLCASLAAQAGAAPLLALQLGRLYPWSVLSSVLAVPISAAGLWMGLVAMALAPVPGLGWLANRVLALLLFALRTVALGAARIPGSAMPVDRRAGLWMAVAVGWLWAARWALRSPWGVGWLSPANGEDGGRRAQWRPWLIFDDRDPRLLRNAQHGKGLSYRPELHPAAHAQASEAAPDLLRIVPGDLERSGKPSLGGFWLVGAGRGDRRGADGGRRGPRTRGR
ncbi:MAG: ComEC family competence protein [Candidatus Bipolaricaulota bacterium]